MATHTSLEPSDNTIGPVIKRAETRPETRPAPYTVPKPILLSNERRSRIKKSIKWQPEDKIHQYHYFEFIADERINVTRLNNSEQQTDANASSTESNKFHLSGGKVTHPSVDNNSRRSNGNAESEKFHEYSTWRPLVTIDFTPELPSPGWNSLERTAQAERESYVLGAIDLPGQPSTLDEPDGQATATTTTTTTTNAKDEASGIKIIPLENPEGMYTEYPDMYNSEIVNGVNTSYNQQPFTNLHISNNPFVRGMDYVSTTICEPPSLSRNFTYSEYQWDFEY